MKKLAILLAAVIFSACATTAPSDSEPEVAAPPETQVEATDNVSSDDSERTYVIGMSTLNLSNPFFIALTDAAREYAEQNNAELMLNDSRDSVERQIEALENFIASEVDAIVVTAVDPVAILPVVSSARAQGIVVVCHTTKLDEYDAWVAADEYDMGFTLGLTAGEWIAENWGTDEEIQAATLNFDTIPQVINRKIGIMEGVAVHAPNVVFVADATAGDPQAGMQATENFIQAHPDLRVVLGINDGGALGAYEAFQAAGKSGDNYLIGGIDATPEGIARVREGGIFRVTVDQAPTTAGRTVIELALKAIRGETFEPHFLQELVPVTLENIDDF